jgi:hypothetical protein
MEKLCSDCTEALQNDTDQFRIYYDKSLPSFRQAIEDGCVLCNILWGNLRDEDKSFFEKPEAKLTMQVYEGFKPLPNCLFSLRTSDMSCGWEKTCYFQEWETSSAGKLN